ncbi:cysQ protein [Salmonella enterica subsp. enterica serovar Derby]|nr:cysQ protein [Salmonella enterica subsp. enterica serovar Derby]
MLEQVCQLARNAGDAIMQVYDGAKPMEYAASRTILQSLRRISPHIP